MTLDWNEYLKELKATIGDIGHISPDLTRGYATLANAGSKTENWTPRPAS